MKKAISLLLFNFIFFECFSQMDISEQLINTTIKITGSRDSIINGKRHIIRSTGTGFYFNFLYDHDTIPVIVTNKHVINKCYKGTLRFKSFSDNQVNYNDLLTIDLDNFESRWIKHPDEDLAITLLIPIKEMVYKKYKKIPFSVSYNESDIPNDTMLNSLLAIEEVLMIGYPKGLCDDSNDLPIVRKGLTATPVFKNYMNKSRFLLDVPIYTGSSGSPICILNRGSYSDKRKNLFIGERFFLIGVAVESKNYFAKGKTVPKDSIPALDVNTELPFNVAVIIKAKRLLDFKQKTGHK